MTHPLFLIKEYSGALREEPNGHDDHHHYQYDLNRVRNCHRIASSE